MMSGTAISQIIPLCTAPIIYRYYSQNFIGAQALFMSIVSMLLGTMTAKYEMAINIPDDENEAKKIVSLTNFVSFVSALIFMIGFSFLKSFFVVHYQISNFYLWLILLPIALFFSAIKTTLFQWFVRKKKFRMINLSTLVQAGIPNLIFVVFAFINPSENVLLIGYVIGALLAGGILYYIYQKKNDVKNNFHQLAATAKKYKNFPIMQWPANLLDNISSQIIIFLIARYYGIAAAGIFSVGLKYVNVPMSLIGNSLSAVMTQRVAEDINKTGDCRAIYLKMVRKLFIAGLILCLILYFFSPWACTIVLGAKWRISGRYIQIMCLLYFSKFIANPICIISVIRQKQRYILLWQSTLFVLSTSAILVGYFLYNSIQVSLFIYSLVYFAMYSIDISMNYRFSKKNY